MRFLLHTILLYLAVVLVCAIVFSFVLCNIVYYLISSSAVVIKATEILSYILAVVFVILYVRCRPLTKEELREKPFLRILFGQGR